MAAGSGSGEDTSRPEDPPHPSDAIYADGPETGEIRVSADQIRAEAEDLADDTLQEVAAKAASRDDRPEKGDDGGSEKPGEGDDGGSDKPGEADGDPDEADDDSEDGDHDEDGGEPEDGDDPGEPGAPASSRADADGEPDPVAAAKPDDVIREPGDISPDTAEGETGEARRVGAEGETRPMEGGAERPNPKLALVYNPIKVDADALRGSVERLSAEAGWEEPLFYETTVDDLGDDVTRQALEVGVNAVLVAGGDGTVRAVSEAMAGSGVPLTIVPSGTGNLLARNLRLPLDDPETMIRATFEGDSIGVDIGFAALRRPTGKTEEHAFVVMGGMGLDAAMIANTSPQLKKSVGWVAYVDGAARSLAGAKPFRIMYQISGHRLHSARVQSVLFANCGSLPAGLELIPEASVTDGSMDIVVFQPKGPLGWIFVWRRVAWDNSFLRKFRAGRRVLALRTRDNAVRYARGAELEVGATEPQFVQLDGDEFGEAVSVRARVVPGGLEITVPEGHDVSGL
ncbi:diacylglycerol kinase family protein [Microbacterium sp. BK668]|uniref:diacylglycerol kinase family protein n=1 Tax=Microbacterium sp. BK668 TaxID=2512118 RepID=UPI0010E88CD8|nr:diacylglycerol kinase family protein [Microbacterium sp. BK668]TDN91462.1 diacylglycerol kinase family enzyme [Microbacterium sp. BK668]